MECKESNCGGKIVDGHCQVCGATAKTDQTTAVPTAPASILSTSSAEPNTFTDDLLRKSQKLQSLVPDDYASWRSQADLFLAAISRLETREIEPDESVKLMNVPLRESALRDASEQALRNCAHFAQTFDERVRLIDHANRVRRTTWF